MPRSLTDGNNSSRVRIVRLLLDQLKTIDGVKHVSSALLRWDDERLRLRMPALFVSSGSGGASQSHPGDRHRDVVPLVLTGYALAKTTDPEAVIEAREQLYKAAMDAIFSGEMESRLIADLAAHDQNGTIELDYDVGPDTDEGQVPPHAIFKQPLTALVHYGLGNL